MPTYAQAETLRPTAAEHRPFVEHWCEFGGWPWLVSEVRDGQARPVGPPAPFGAFASSPDPVPARVRRRHAKMRGQTVVDGPKLSLISPGLNVPYCRTAEDRDGERSTFEYDISQHFTLIFSVKGFQVKLRAFQLPGDNAFDVFSVDREGNSHAVDIALNPGPPHPIRIIPETVDRPAR